MIKKHYHSIESDKVTDLIALDRIMRSLFVDYRFGSPLDIPITSPALHSPANMPAASPASNVIAASPYHPHGEQRKAECFITRLE